MLQRSLRKRPARTACGCGQHSTAQHTRGDAEAERQHKHDAKRKDQDRKGVIRREVYVKTIEATYASPGAYRAWGVDSEK